MTGIVLRSSNRHGSRYAPVEIQVKRMKPITQAKSNSHFMTHLSSPLSRNMPRGSLKSDGFVDAATKILNDCNELYKSTCIWLTTHPKTDVCPTKYNKSSLSNFVSTSDDRPEVRTYASHRMKSKPRKRFHVLYMSATVDNTPGVIKHAIKGCVQERFETTSGDIIQSLWEGNNIGQVETLSVAIQCALNIEDNGVSIENEYVISTIWFCTEKRSQDVYIYYRATTDKAPGLQHRHDTELNEYKQTFLSCGFGHMLLRLLQRLVQQCATSNKYPTIYASIDKSCVVYYTSIGFSKTTWSKCPNHVIQCAKLQSTLTDDECIPVVIAHQVTDDIVSITRMLRIATRSAYAYNTDFIDDHKLLKEKEKWAIELDNILLKDIHIAAEWERCECVRVFIEKATSGAEMDAAMENFYLEWSEKSAVYLSVFLGTLSVSCIESTVLYDDYLLGKILLCPSVYCGETTATVYIYCAICRQVISTELSVEQECTCITDFGKHGRGIIAHHFYNPFGQTNIATPDEVLKANAYIKANGGNGSFPQCADRKGGSLYEILRQLKFRDHRHHPRVQDIHSRLYRQRLMALFHLLEKSFWNTLVGNVRKRYKDELQSIETLFLTHYNVGILENFFITQGRGEDKDYDGKHNHPYHRIGTGSAYESYRNSLCTHSLIQNVETAQPGELSENDIKMCWQTLEKFDGKSRPNDRVNRPCSLALKRSNCCIPKHFIGGAMCRTTRSTNTRNAIHYFVVSDELIPPNPSRRCRDDAFEKNWINNLEANVEHEIPTYIKNKLINAVTNWRKEFIVKIRAYTNNEGDLSWQGMDGNNRIEGLSSDWLIDNFFYDNDYYAALFHQSNINGDWMNVPTGQRNFENDALSHTPPCSGKSLYFHFRQDPHCAFGNMCNILHLLGDEETAKHVYKEKETCATILLTPNQCAELGKNRYSRYHIVLIYMRSKFGYQFRKLACNHNVYTPYPMQYDGIYFIPKVLVLATSHVVSIHGDTIIDGAHSHTMPLNAKNLDWCCGAGNKYTGVSKGVYITMPKRIRLEIRNRNP